MKSGDQRFESGSAEYAGYLESPEGRLRTDLAFANLQDFLPNRDATSQSRALDVGCGTGELGVRLARLGYEVRLVDASEQMLASARRAVEREGLANRVAVSQADASRLKDLLPAASFDVVVCHNVLEFVDDPAAALAAMAEMLAGSSAVLSVVVRNRYGEVLKAALRDGDLATAASTLTAEFGVESLYGGNVRLFLAEKLRDVLEGASLEVLAERGIRVITDYLPPRISREAEYARILELERTLGKHAEYAAVARYTHILARRMERAR